MPRKTNRYEADEETHICYPEGVERKGLFACRLSGDTLTKYGVSPGAVIVGRRLTEGDRPAAGSLCAFRTPEIGAGQLLIVKKLCRGGEGNYLLIDDEGKGEVKAATLEIVAVGLYACTCYRDQKKCSPHFFDIGARDTVHAVTERLRRIYAGELWTDRSHLSRITRRLYRLAEHAQVPEARERYRKPVRRHQIYSEAAGSGFADSYEAREVRRALLASEEWTESVTGGKKPPRRAQAERDEYTLAAELPIFGICGFVPSDRVLVRPAGDLNPWEIGAVKIKDDNRTFIGRVIRFDSEAVTLRDDTRDKSFTREQITFIGRVDPEPVGRVDGLTDEQRTRLNQLRDKLDDLDGEDDQIIRCTARFKLEREIYNIEHPAREGVGSDDWSAWEVQEDE